MNKLTGCGIPTPNTVGQVGQYYEDLNTGNLYECRISSKYSPTHGWPVGGYVWELRATGEDVRELYGSVSAAQSDWNAAEGEPGHVLNRTHYENGTETKTLLDSTVTVASNQFQGVGYVTLMEGNTYTVTWDGAEYECDAFISNALGFSAPALGNPYFSGGENNGLPFGFVSASEYGQYGGAAATNGSHSIKITEEVKKYKKLDECYLPTGLMPYVHRVGVVTLQDGKPAHPLTNIAAAFDVIANVLWNGGRVILDFTRTELVNEGFYKAEVTEWKASKQPNGSYHIGLYYYYDGNRIALFIMGGTWTPPTE